MSANPKTQGVICPLLLIYFADEPSTGSHLTSEHVSVRWLIQGLI